jgi:hypothetical protein
VLAAILDDTRRCPKGQVALGVKMDWSGSISVVSGLVLVVFAHQLLLAHMLRTDGNSQYILETLTMELIILIAAVFVERWIAEMPLLSLELFEVPRLGALVLALLPTFRSLGVFLLYSTL